TKASRARHRAHQRLVNRARANRRRNLQGRNPGTTISSGGRTIQLSQPGGVPGQLISFILSGFSPNQTATLLLGQAVLTAVPIGPTGTATGTFVVPNVRPGSY